MTEVLIELAVVLVCVIIVLVWAIDSHVKRCWVFRQDKYGGFTTSTSYTKIFWHSVRYKDMGKGSIRFQSIDACIAYMQKELPDNCNVDVKFIMDVSHLQTQEKV